MIDNVIKPNVRRLKAYVAKEIPCDVKLDANESPYGFNVNLNLTGIGTDGGTVSDGNIGTKVNAGTDGCIETNRYPDPGATAVREVLAGKWKVDVNSIVHGNGSDELIYYLLTATGGPVLYPVPTFVMYGIIAETLGEQTVSVPLDDRFDLDLPKMLDAIERHNPKVVFLSSPNNPTGNMFSRDKIVAIIKASRGLVVVDEAYLPFSGEAGFISSLQEYENLLVMRTLSKVGLAALRMGFLIGDAAIIGEINKVRLPYNVNSLSQAIALSSLQNADAMEKYISLVAEERKRLFGQLCGIDGLTPLPSEANFILVRVATDRILPQALLEEGILVKDLGSILPGYFRVTVGRPGENDKFLNAVKKIMRKGK